MSRVKNKENVRFPARQMERQVQLAVDHMVIASIADVVRKNLRDRSVQWSAFLSELEADTQLRRYVP